MKRAPSLAFASVVLLAIVCLRACKGEGEFVAPPAEDLGTLCLSRDDCSYACLPGLDGAAPYCTLSCADQACHPGYVCVARAGLGPVCAMGACSGDGDCPAGYQCDTAQAVCVHGAIACTIDNDCPAAIACNQNQCAIDCGNDDDCKQGYHCNGGHGCVQCRYAADCGNGFACREGVCTSGCVEAEDCRYGFACAAAHCNPIDGNGPAELGAACAEDADCADFCFHNTCSRVCNGPDDVTTCGAGFVCDPYHLVCMPQP